MYVEILCSRFSPTAQIVTVRFTVKIQLLGLFTCLASNKLVKPLPPKVVLGKGVFLEMSIARKDHIF